MPKVLFVVGARPNLPKVAPILAALPPGGALRPLLVHTGQHRDVELSRAFFEDLGLPPPDHLLEVAPSEGAGRLARIMEAFEPVCRAQTPAAVVVVGDVDSTLACALVASRLGLPLAHVEAGLRSGDRTMPEEINRRVTDHLATRRYTHCQEATDNLLAEGVPGDSIELVGNTMIDTLSRFRARAVRPRWAGAMGLDRRGYGLVTLHRPALVDDPGRLTEMIRTLAELSADLPLVFPVHPRTRDRLRAHGQLPAGQHLDDPWAVTGSRLWLVRAVRYLEFIHLQDQARLVLTDSGGVQEETSWLGVPCLTVRDNTERPVTVEHGTNRLVGIAPDGVLTAAREVLAAPFPSGGADLPGWDGRAGPRIAGDLARWLADG